MSERVVIVDGVRLPQGNFGSFFKSVPAQDLGALAVRSLLKKINFQPAEVEEVVFGCVLQQSDAPNIARIISQKAGIPNEVPAFSVQRNCASGLQAIVSACQMIQLGEADVVLAGGVESMSSYPYINRDLRFGKKFRNSEMIDTIWEGLTDPICKLLMGETAESLADEFKISREEQDAYALLSHRRATEAVKSGRFQSEIVPVDLAGFERSSKNPQPKIIQQDESIRPETSMEALAGLHSVFRKGGSVTAGNSSPLSDGAACVLLMSETRAKSMGARFLGVVKSYAFVGLEPERMGLGPVYAIPKVLKRAKMNLKDINLFEINEAFAAQYLACEKPLELDRNRVNVNGGAIALGHPVGATGVRLVLTLLNEMQRRNVSTGVASMCIGGGQGGAVVLEKI